jgi:hypothetical protein
MRILAGGFNFNWMEFDSPDSDKDGVLDADDTCPNTPENTIVDVTGCEIFSLSADNFFLTTTSETCRSQNNGSIVLSAIENHDYSVTLFNDNFSGTKTFTSEVALEDLSAGTYALCVTINGNSTYEQCFTVIVIEPDLLSVSTSGKSSKTKKVTVSLAGGQSYYVTLNNETTITSASEIELELNQGTNNLSVKTNKDCQGVYNKTIIFNSEPFVYPNPIKNNTISINSFEFSENEVPVEIYNLKGQLLFSKSYNSATNQLKIDVSNIPNGIYILKIISKEEIFNYKIIK